MTNSNMDEIKYKSAIKQIELKIKFKIKIIF